VTAPSRIVTAVLAAGRARRFGSDKLLAPFRGKPLAANVADVLARMPFVARLAICPAGAPERAALFTGRGFTVIENPEAERGMSSSLALAAEYAASTDAEALVVCLADMPNVTAAHIKSLLAAAAGAEIVATEAAGVRSPPAVFARSRMADLIMLSGDHGGKELLGAAALVSVAPEVVRDIDRPEDFR
jgi:molybdenum cofactor cytidylyltransferase